MSGNAPLQLEMPGIAKPFAFRPLQDSTSQLKSDEDALGKMRRSAEQAAFVRGLNPDGQLTHERLRLMLEWHAVKHFECYGQILPGQQWWEDDALWGQVWSFSFKGVPGSESGVEAAGHDAGRGIHAMLSLVKAHQYDMSQTECTSLVGSGMKVGVAGQVGWDETDVIEVAGQKETQECVRNLFLGGDGVLSERLALKILQRAFPDDSHEEMRLRFQVGLQTIALASRSFFWNHRLPFYEEYANGSWKPAQLTAMIRILCQRKRAGGRFAIQVVWESLVWEKLSVSKRGPQLKSAAEV